MLPHSRPGKSVSNPTLKAVWWRLTLVLTIALSWLIPPARPLRAQTDAPLSAENIFANMTVAERVGQLFLVTFPGSALRANDPIVDLIANYHIGGVILQPDSDNFVSEGDVPRMAAELINQLQTVALTGPSSLITETTDIEPVEPTSTPTPTGNLLPLLVAVQQEGDGPTQDYILQGVTELPSQMAIGATWQPEFARTIGEISGRELSALGFNMLLGPSLDVLASPAPAGSNEIGVRSFGGNPYWVGKMGAAYVQGLHEGSGNRMAVIAKHFPGFGGSDRPLGEEVATLRRSLSELEQSELVPFAAVAESSDAPGESVDGLMTTHVRFQGLQDDSQVATGPVTFDPQALQLILALPEFTPWRANGGLVVSDSLGSRAVRQYYDDTGVEFPHRRVAKDALIAGHDLLTIDDFALQPGDFAAQMANIRDTIIWFQERYGTDPAFQSRVDDAVKRIIQQKLDLYGGSFQPEQVLINTEQLAEILTQDEDQITVYQVSERAVSLTASNQAELPGSPGPNDSIVIFTDVREARQCSDCPLVPYIGATALEEKILSLYGPQGSNQIQTDRIRSFTYADLKAYLTAAPEPTPVPATSTPPPLPTGSPEPGATPVPDVTVTLPPPATPTPNLVDILGLALQDVDWIIFAALDVSEAAPASDALNLFLSQRTDLVRDSRVVVLSYSVPYFLDTTELSKLSAFYTAYSKIEASVDASIRALFLEAPLAGAPPISLASIGYDLEYVTQPLPSQIIDLYIEQGGTLQVPAGDRPLEVVVGEALRLYTGTILDRNGNPVPDGTLVQFWQTDRLEGLTSFLSEQPTVDGVARLDYVLEARTGQFRITATSGDARNSQQVDIIIGDNVRIVVVTLTPGPTPSSTPTQAPTETSTPPPTITPTATPTPIPPPPEPAVRITLATFSKFSGFITGLLLISVMSLLIGRRAGLTEVNVFLRLALVGLVGGLVFYNYYLLQLPGSSWLNQLGNWAGLLATVGGGILILLFAAPLLRRGSDSGAT